MAANGNLIIAKAPTTIFVAGTDVGYSLGGIKLGMDVGKFDVVIDQSNIPLSQSLISKVQTVTIPFAQSEVSVVKHALMVATANAIGTTMLILDANDEPAAVTLGFIVTNQGGNIHRFFWHAVTLDSFSETTVNKAQQVVWEARFRVQPASGTTSTLGYMYIQAT